MMDSLSQSHRGARTVRLRGQDADVPAARSFDGEPRGGQRDDGKGVRVGQVAERDDARVRPELRLKQRRALRVREVAVARGDALLEVPGIRRFAKKIWIVVYF